MIGLVATAVLPDRAEGSGERECERLGGIEQPPPSMRFRIGRGLSAGGPYLKARKSPEHRTARARHPLEAHAATYGRPESLASDARNEQLNGRAMGGRCR